MSDLTQIIVAICSMLGVLGVAWIGYKTQLIKNNTDRTAISNVKQENKLEQIHGEMNGIKSELVATTKKLALKEGKEQGRAEEKAKEQERKDNE